jgi:hypothetical protein
MSSEERIELLIEIEEIIATIERLQPEVYAQEAAGARSDRARLVALRKDLARDVEQLHAT